MEMTNKEPEMVELFNNVLEIFVLNHSKVKKTVTIRNCTYFAAAIGFDKIKGHIEEDGSVQIKFCIGKTIDTIKYSNNSFSYSHTIVQDANFFRKRTKRRDLTNYRLYYNEERYFQECTVNNDLLDYDTIKKLNIITDYILGLKC